MSETAAVEIDAPPHPALQAFPDTEPASSAGTDLATGVLTGTGPLDDHVCAVGEYLSRLPGVDNSIVAITALRPSSPRDWVKLGDRAWLREWLPPGSNVHVAPAANGDGHQALTLPWLSQQARSGAVTAVPDLAALPDEAAVDVDELRASGVGALAVIRLTSYGTMFGSMSMSRTAPGRWPDQDLADLRLLAHALASRMSAERSRALLVDAVAGRDQIRTSQHQLFSALGHELRAPISTILDSCAALRHLPDTGSLADYHAEVDADASRVLDAGEQLFAVVNDLTGTGRELGAADTDWVNVSDAVHDVLHWHRTGAVAADIALGSDVPENLVARSTPSGLRQILSTLVGNAVTYTQSGGLVVVAASLETGEAGPQVRITVSDTGAGLTEAQQAVVFNPFVRFAGNGSSGTGLGLPLSRTIAERDGGHMGVESTPGSGATFWVTLPGHA